MNVDKQQSNTIQPYDTLAPLLEKRHLFWDVVPASINPDKYRKFIIERVLRYGFPEDVQIVLNGYDSNSIKEVIRTSCNLDRKTANYWAIHFNIPREEIRCFSMPSITPCFR